MILQYHFDVSIHESKLCSNVSQPTFSHGRFNLVSWLKTSLHHAGIGFLLNKWMVLPRQGPKRYCSQEPFLSRQHWSTISEKSRGKNFTLDQPDAFNAPMVPHMNTNSQALWWYLLEIFSQNWYLGKWSYQFLTAFLFFILFLDHPMDLKWNGISLLKSICRKVWGGYFSKVSMLSSKLLKMARALFWNCSYHILWYIWTMVWIW